MYTETAGTARARTRAHARRHILYLEERKPQACQTTGTTRCQDCKARTREVGNSDCGNDKTDQRRIQDPIRTQSPGRHNESETQCSKGVTVARRSRGQSSRTQTAEHPKCVD